ncbi:uncharacterized protein LOC107274257 [Cephus cinctus]|uniref:Uncharacterized protein LOC107274257 n=1 Tax=Cephus cinctus TaxID=211228 RepID=A0AAJ7RV62_CEPCN|nr:uncharacterized protein LOC107274257 [Cephus cinctus]
MGATQVVLGSVILGLFWSSFVKGFLMGSTNRCDAPPCYCNHYGWLTCDCRNEGEELLLTAEGERRLSPHTSRIFVSNCSSVILRDSSLSSMTGLQSVDFLNIGNLTLARQSFEISSRSSHVKISLKNASIVLLPSFVFNGDVSAISFENVQIGKIGAFAFANLHGTEILRFENCHVESMQSQAFKKFDVEHFHAIGGSFGENVPSRTLNDIEVHQEFILDGVDMGTVRSAAFILKGPRTVTIQNCVLGNVESDAFVITTRGDVIIKNNEFRKVNVGAFLRIKAEPLSTSSLAGRSTLIFKNNTIGSFEAGSIMFDRQSFRVELDSLYIDRQCDCSLLPTWKNDIDILNYSGAYAKYHLGAEVGSRTSPLEESILRNSGTLLCVNGHVDGGATSASFDVFEDRYCATSRSILLFVLILVGVFLALVAAGILIVWYCKRYHRNNQKSWISVPKNAPDLISNNKKNGVIGKDGATARDRRITMVVPDGRMYRETEFHVIVEKAEPLTTEL